jgi:RNA polymerase sigma-70 factor (ECF subfamily)
VSESADDEQMMARIQQGDYQAFERLVEQHLNPLYRFAWRMLGNSKDADDIVQETFIKVWRNAHQWHAGKAKLSTWLHSIVHHDCIDLYRQQNQFVTVDLAEAAEVMAPETTSGIYQMEISEQVEYVLQQLPPRQKSAVLLCYYQGLNNQEAADILNINVAALESLLARARKTLKQLLQG